MAISQNGWTALDSGSSYLYTWTIPGTNVKVRIRNGSAGFLLVFCMLWWHEVIDDITKPHPRDDWGHAERPIRGSTKTSNHHSGTAVDVDATEHPLGVPNTLMYRLRGARVPKRMRGQIAAAALRTFLRTRMRGAVRWGGDYTSRKDDMHLEINTSLNNCEVIARRLMNTPRGRRILEANPGQKAVILS